MENVSTFQKNHLVFDLVKISLKELFFLDYAVSDIFGLDDGRVTKIISKNTPISNDVIAKLLSMEIHELYINRSGLQKMMEQHRIELHNSSRALSIGNPLNNAYKQLNLLCINLKYFYTHPEDDELLMLLYQGLKNFSHFLIDHSEDIPRLYKKFIVEKHHFKVVQPVLSSILLLAFLLETKQFSKPEIESLFITSALKDVGMSLLPEKLLSKGHLTQAEKNTIATHPLNSVKILKDRIPLKNDSLSIILNHHYVTKESFQLSDTVFGLETVLVTITDLITAVINPRPYRKKLGLYHALDMTKLYMQDEYKKEFILLIKFLQKFF